MAALLWARHRLGRPGHAHALVVRFSGVATVALGAVAVAGMIMAVFVLDSFGELTGTVWGRVLLLKTAAVAIASGFGAYNHFVLLPALDAAPDDPEVEAAVRSSVTAEGILLTFVVVVTASLVAAAS
jgi:copper transport protein